MFPSRTKLLNRIYNHTLKTGEPLSLSLDDETSPNPTLDIDNSKVNLNKAVTAM